MQTVVDSKHKLIAAYEVTNDGNDLGQLANMAKKGKEALLSDELTVLADGGYFDGDTIKEVNWGPRFFPKVFSSEFSHSL